MLPIPFHAVKVYMLFLLWESPGGEVCHVNLSPAVRHPCTQYRAYEPSQQPSRADQVFLSTVETLACVREVLSRLVMHNSEKGTMKGDHDCCGIDEVS